MLSLAIHLGAPPIEEQFHTHMYNIQQQYMPGTYAWSIFEFNQFVQNTIAGTAIQITSEQILNQWVCAGHAKKLTLTNFVLIKRTTTTTLWLTVLAYLHNTK